MPRPDRVRFAAKLRRLRDLNGRMTQEELAELHRFELGFGVAYDLAGYPAQPPTLGETLKSLRKSAGLTQGEPAKGAGISMFSVRAYEQGKRVPTDDQRAALAKALNVPDEVLTDFGVKSANDAFHYLLELAHIYGMRPQRHYGIVLLAHAGRKKPLDKLIRDWSFEWVGMRETGDEVACQSWNDGRRS